VDKGVRYYFSSHSTG